MNSTEIAFLSATETAKAIKAKELSPTEAVQAYLERIDRLVTVHLVPGQQQALVSCQDSCEFRIVFFLQLSNERFLQLVAGSIHQVEWIRS